jgi:hypothetical protein
MAGFDHLKGVSVELDHADVSSTSSRSIIAHRGEGKAAEYNVYIQIWSQLTCQPKSEDMTY